MDTLSHALGGALVARTFGGSVSNLPPVQCTLAGLIAAAFPDIDFALFWIAPLEFLNSHRGPTHSLVLLPFWALLLAVLLSRWSRICDRWQDYYGICVLGLGIHIVGDVITIYGTKLLSPLSDETFALNLIFDLDPYVALIIGAGFIGSVFWRPKRALGLTVFVIVGYLMLQGVMQARTLGLGERFAAARGLSNAQSYAFPQPFLPLTWQVIVSHEERYWQAYVSYLPWRMTTASEQDGLATRVLASYRPANTLQWQSYSQFGDDELTQTLARTVWQQGRLTTFRQFARLPALYRINHDKTGALCVWFTELRHIFPVLPPSFRYGACRCSDSGLWHLYRLRYFRAHDKQRLGSTGFKSIELSRGYRISTDYGDTK